MANGFGFAGGLARGLQRSFPDVGGIMREERVREEDRDLKRQEQEQKRQRAIAETRMSENTAMAEKIIDQTKRELHSEVITPDDEDYQNHKRNYMSMIQNANLARATLGLGPVPGHSPDGSDFDNALRNVTTVGQESERELEELRTKEKVKKQVSSESELSKRMWADIDGVRGFYTKQEVVDAQNRGARVTNKEEAGKKLSDTLSLAIQAAARDETEATFMLDVMSGKSDAVLSPEQAKRVFDFMKQSTDPLMRALAGLISGGAGTENVGTATETSPGLTPQQRERKEELERKARGGR